MKYRAFDDLPVVKPATAKPNDFHDTLLQRTKQTAEESEQLDRILAHYQEGLEKKIAEEERIAAIPGESDDVVQI